ncbi:hypothetical protein L2E82_16402 [Cichorium intybus]|uniref:Uncharacterized protein n=1 Tax=Cichorium intybus TaxID=13427 RepID=A0ACB9F6R5_CICIN|nr:hypothetical protein L2E82_16402 [Cichorium intybus]
MSLCWKDEVPDLNNHEVDKQGESCIPVIENDESDKGNGDEVVDLNIDLNEEQGEQMMEDVEQRENMMEDVEEYTVETETEKDGEANNSEDSGDNDFNKSEN